MNNFYEQKKIGTKIAQEYFDQYQLNLFIHIDLLKETVIIN